tara:strand:- start:39134 stop:39391 length:258 start_codon:yes stop_codon:yes gene_type:complete
MAKLMTDEEVAQKRRDADLRQRIKFIFDPNLIVREDAHDALKEAWCIDEPSFDLGELATMDPQAATLSAMRRDSIKEVINWLLKL